MDDLQFAYFFVQLVTAGNDTTRTMISSGLLELLEHPDQLEKLRADPSLAGSAVEEVLRHAPPLHYFRRTLTSDTEIRGVPMAAGDKLAMMYSSANRDEDAFADPDTFDITPPSEPAPRVRDRRALLPGRAPRPPRGTGVPRGAARALAEGRARR